MNLEPEILEILKTRKAASLGTLLDGKPYVSAVGYIYEPSGDPGHPGHIYFLASDLSQHTRNLKKDPAVSMLITSEQSGETPIQEVPRMTLQGRVEAVSSNEQFQELKARFLELYPRAAVFFQLPDFRFYRMTISELYWIGGFGKARVYR